MKTSVKLNRTNLNRYAGKWVAFIDGRVLASDRTLEKLMKKVKTRRLKKKPSVFLVPRKDEGPYILIVL